MIRESNYNSRRLLCACNTLIYNNNDLIFDTCMMKFFKDIFLVSDHPYNNSNSAKLFHQCLF